MQLEGTQIADYKLTYSENNITTTNKTNAIYIIGNLSNDYS
jgi:hypothetical protein